MKKLVLFGVLTLLFSGSVFVNGYSKTTVSEVVVQQEDEVPEHDDRIVYEVKFLELKRPMISESDLLLVGDSRFVGMRDAVESESQFFCKVGQGYSWFIENIDAIEALISDNTVIIFGLGVNDLYNINKYLSLEEWQHFDKTYFLSVNPVNEEVESKYGYSVMNKEIDSFNAKMFELFGDRVIDTNTYLREVGFSTRDGLHYTAETYNVIYEFIEEVVTNED